MSDETAAAPAADTSTTAAPPAAPAEATEESAALDYFKARGLDLTDRPTLPSRGGRPRARPSVTDLAEGGGEEEEAGNEAAAVASSEADLRALFEADAATAPTPGAKAAPQPLLTREEAAVLADVLTSKIDAAKDKVEDDPARAGYWRREAARMQRELEAVRQAPTTTTTAPAQPEEAMPDLFEAPEKFVDLAIRKATGEMQAKIAQLEAELSKTRQGEVSRQLRDAEQAYDSTPEGRGYFERRPQYVRIFSAHLQARLGMSEEEARETVAASDRAILQLARARGINPIEFADDTYRMWIAFDQSKRAGKPAAPPAAAVPIQRPDATIAAAQAAGRAAVAGSIAQGDGTDAEAASPTTISRSATIERVRKGRSNFFALAEKAEKQLGRRR